MDACFDENIWTKKTIEKGRILFLEGDPGDDIYYILEGAIKVFILDSSGRENILALLGPGDFVGEMSIIDEKPRSATAQALEKSQVLVLNRTLFASQIKENPSIAFRIIQILVERLRKTDQQLLFQVCKTARQRVGKAILDLAEKFGRNTDEGILINLRITHQDLAAYSGVARETATRMVQDFLNSNLLKINPKNCLIVTDLEEFRMTVFE